MKRICILFTLVCAYTFLSAQETKSKFSIGAFASPTVVSRILSADDTLDIFADIINDVEAPKAGYSTGVFASYAFNKKLSIQTGVSFTNNGYLDKKTNDLRYGSQFDGTGFNPNLPLGQSVTAIKFVKHFYYLDIPVQLKYTFFKKGKFSLYVLGGMEANFNLANKQTMITWSSDEKERETTEYDKAGFYQFRKYNCSVTAGAGMDIALSTKVSFFAQVDYRQMLLPNMKDAAIRRRLYTVGLELGVRINL